MRSSCNLHGTMHRIQETSLASLSPAKILGTASAQVEKVAKPTQPALGKFESSDLMSHYI
jgi:hypothetical protein